MAKTKLAGLKEEREAITIGMEAGWPMLVTGETGTGKTSLVVEVAETLSRDVVRVNFDGAITPDMLVGRFQARRNEGATETYFQHGALPDAMKRGAVLLLDEVNSAMPDTLFLLHAVTENNPRLYIPETGETITPEPGFCVVGTMNPSHDYAGTRELNKAFLSRFRLTVKFSPLIGRSLVSALKQHACDKITDEILLAVAKILEHAAKMRKAEKINARLSIREGIACLGAISSGMPFDKAVRYCIANKLEEYELPHFEPVFTSGIPSPLSTSLDDLLNEAGKSEALNRELVEARAELARLANVSDLFAKIAVAVKS